MNSKELKQKYLNFFERKGHKIIPSAPLIPENDPTALFTTAGMHPLVPFLLGLEHSAGRRLVNVQKCLRTDDIDEVGDNWHNTFFEMLGNWSFGDYGKKEAIGWSYEFITKELNIPENKLWVTVFAGDVDSPKDEESVKIWRSLGITESRIIPLGKQDNWWGPVGEIGPCGPDTEMFIDTTGKPHGSNTLTKNGSVCRPGDNCGRFSEIWNDVFMEYDRQKDGTYKPLKQKNVDTGMGIERTIAVLQGKDNIYETELFSSVIKLLKEKSSDYQEHSARIVADHLRATVFISAEGIIPLNKDQGYVLRRLLRRSIRHLDLIGASDQLEEVLKLYIRDYSDVYPEIKQEKKIVDLVKAEKEKFRKVIQEGLLRSENLLAAKKPISEEKYKKMMKNTGKKEIFRDFYKGKESVLDRFNLDLSKSELIEATISGKEAFDLYQSFGFPIDMIIDLAQVRNLLVNVEDLESEIERHQKVSRAGMEKKFAGGLADHSDITIRGHTATHLLHQALRDVLGNHVQQTGSNITPERIRFDFSHPEKLTSEQVKKVEEIVNQKIKDDLIVKKELLTQKEADKKGAIGLFREKYDDKVSIYEIGDYSTEYCGGPHVEHTSQVGNFEIIKEESLAAGQRRIRAILK